MDKSTKTQKKIITKKTHKHLIKNKTPKKKQHKGGKGVGYYGIELGKASLNLQKAIYNTSNDFINLPKDISKLINNSFKKISF